MSKSITVAEIREMLDTRGVTAIEAAGIIGALCNSVGALEAKREELRAKVAELEAERWPIPGTEGDERYTARVLLGRVVAGGADSAARYLARKRPALAWSSVSIRTGLGRGYAAALCRTYGFDPDTGEALDDDGGAE